jgi:hypothetical protein
MNGMDCRSDECVICFDTPSDNGDPRVYLECCGKPICTSCKSRHEKNDDWGTGCPCCRSTLGVVYVCIDLAHLWCVRLRLNGNYLIVSPSARTVRRYLSRGAAPYEIFVKKPRTPRTEVQLSKSLVVEAVLSISAFLEHEVIQNIALRDFVAAQCGQTDTFWRYAVFWSVLPPHPDDE